jgi:tRNA threonylcarbamoyladenosine modification (KEOPS) complex  Pcc1 subunit
MARQVSPNSDKINAVVPSVKEWRSFCSTWRGTYRELNSAIWSGFFAAFKSLAIAEPPKTQFEIAPALFAQFFASGGDILRKFYVSGEAISMWKVAGLKREEVRTCSVLAWLLDRHEDHGQGDAFLRCFFDCMGTAGFPISTEAIDKGYRTRVESSYNTSACEHAESPGKRKRMDIEINGPDLLLFIEAKIDTSEAEGQLEGYLNILRSRAGNRGWALVFLTPSGRSPKADSGTVQSKIAAVSWRSIATRFMRHIDQNMPKDSFGTVFIRQFCKHIHSF